MKRVWIFAQEKKTAEPLCSERRWEARRGKKAICHIFNFRYVWQSVSWKKSLVQTKPNRFNLCESIVPQVQIGYSDGPDVNSVRILWYLELQFYFKKYFLSLYILFFTNDFLSSGVTGAPVDIPSILWRPLQAARRGRLVQISILGGAAQFVHNQSQRINI